MRTFVHRTLSAATLLMVALSVMGQTAPNTWWVQFTDKDNTPYSIDQPEGFLTLRAIQRRQQQGIAFDELDLPVDPVYINTVLALGEVQLVNRSKWFNAITIRTSDLAILEAIQQLPFVANLRSTRRFQVAPPIPDKFEAPVTGTTRDGDFGGSFLQISMMNGHLLHEIGAKGQGMMIGVLDSGFENTDVLPAFSALRDRNGILHTKDLVEHDGDVYLDHWHGRSVLSCMAGIVEGQLIGTGPMADYVLVRTEDAATEFIVEEDNWVSGAEYCDSLGVDILNTSLGYTVFDDSTTDHTYEDLDGATSRISIACGIASLKGMIPVVSAGNQGNSDWFHISAPADAFNILAVGAVGAERQYAFFSSQGPSADGRVKPDIAAMGWGATGLGPSGEEVTLLNGTSFSAPLVAGLVACLWQLHPERSAHDVMDAVRRSAHQFGDPDTELGHGIPDFMLAHQLLQGTTSVVERSSMELRVHPVPFQDAFTVMIPGAEGKPVDLQLFDTSGRLLWMERVTSSTQGIRVQDRILAQLKPGAYILRADGAFATTVLKMP
jgi:serine protease AprX